MTPPVREGRMKEPFKDPLSLGFVQKKQICDLFRGNVTPWSTQALVFLLLRWLLHSVFCYSIVAPHWKAEGNSWFHLCMTDSKRQMQRRCGRLILSTLWCHTDPPQQQRSLTLSKQMWKGSNRWAIQSPTTAAAGNGRDERRMARQYGPS